MRERERERPDKKPDGLVLPFVFILAEQPVCLLEF